MKISYLILVALFITLGCSKSDNTSSEEGTSSIENIFVGDTILTTQAEVEVFGSNNYTHIEGSLSLLDEVTDLSPLSSIVEVTGQLAVENTTNLLSLNGLNNLELAGNLRISYNLILTNLDYLENLTTLTGYLRLWSNPELTNIEGLKNLSTVIRNIWIRDNITLPNIDGLENITTVRGLAITDNPLLENIQALSNLEVINSIFIIESCNILANLDGLSSLTTVDGSFLFEYNPAITNLDPLSNLTYVGGSMTFKYHDLLVDFCGITPLLIGNGVEGSFTTYENGYNPTLQDIIDGNCIL